jgi:hypothetical protein
VIKYPAHDESRCEGVHRPGVARAWPDGCLLDPVRVPWRELKVAMANRDRYRVLYQQEDSDPSGVLAPRMWIDGGVDPETQEYHPGCWDADRGIGQWPDHLEGPLVSICAADPSPTMYWAVGWFLVQPSTGQWWLLDLLRRRMDAPEFLEWWDGDRKFTGVMQEWQARSVDLKMPITAWVIEQNAAQRYLLQHEYVRRWQSLWKTRIIGHETHRNKADAEFGVWGLLRPMFRHGRIRLPGSQQGGARLASLKLVDEATLWPDGRTDDTVMMLWMAAHRLPSLIATDTSKMPKMRRPGWLRRTDELEGVAA